MSIFAHMRARTTSSAAAPVSNGPCQTMVSRIGLFQLARPFSVAYSASNTNHIVRSRRKSIEPRDYVGRDACVEQDLHFFLVGRLRCGGHNSSRDLRTCCSG